MTTTTRRWLLAGAFTIGAGLGIAAYDAATHIAQAAPKPTPVVERAGGSLGRQLPAHASDRAKQVHRLLAAAQKPCKPPAASVEQPAEEPAPEPADDPAPQTPEPTSDPVIDLPPVEVPPEVKPIPPAVDLPPIVIHPAPTSDPTPDADPVVTLPSVDPAPLPGADAALPPVLPVVVGPTTTPPPAVVDATVEDLEDTTAARMVAADCDDRTRPPRNIIGQLIDSLTIDAASQSRAKPSTPCTPDNPATPHSACTPATATNTAGGSVTALLADLAAALTTPALDRIEHARARSHLPVGRHVAIEPGPA